MESTSSSLLERLRQPGPEPDRQRAWSRFIELYGPLLLHWARQRGLAEDDACDLVQDVLARLLERLPHFTYDPGQRFRGWLYRVVRNCWSDRLRQQGKEPAAAGSAADQAAAPDNVAEFQEAEHRGYLLRRALEVMRAEFEPTTWRACWAFVAEGRPAAEVAAELGVTANAVYVAKFKVLRRLRTELDGLLD
jgi:RNA polymerase sigma-70 factor (ECF subfamily)